MTRPLPLLPRFKLKTNVVFHALGICRKTWSFASLMPEDFLWHFFSSLVFSPSLRLFAGPLPSRSAQMTSQSREVIRPLSVPFIFCASGIWQTSGLNKRLFQQKNSSTASCNSTLEQNLHYWVCPSATFYAYSINSQYLNNHQSSQIGVSRNPKESPWFSHSESTSWSPGSRECYVGQRRWIRVVIVVEGGRLLSPASYLWEKWISQPSWIGFKKSGKSL